MASAAAGLLIVTLGSAAPAQAQHPGEFRWFPREHAFQQILADPHEPRLAGALVDTDILSHTPRERPPFALPDSAASAHEVDAVVNLGEEFAAARLRKWDDGEMTLGLEVGVRALFRIEQLSRDLAASDWMVAAPLELRRGPWAYRWRLIHRSSHLGDELMQNNGAQRIELGGDGLDFTGARRFGPLRAYAGGEWIFYSETDRDVLSPDRPDRWQAQAGFDGEWHPPGASPRFGVVAGLDWQSVQRTRWGSAWSAVGGIRLDDGAGRSGRLIARYFHGPSPMGEFFLTHETYWGLELSLDL